MGKLCTTCHKMFATSQTLKRHAKAFHKGGLVTNHDHIPISNLDKECNSDSSSGEDEPASETHDDDNNDDDSFNNDSEDSYDGLNLESGEEQAWKEVITHVMGTHNIKKISDVMNDHKFPKFVQELRKEMERRFKLCKAVKRNVVANIYPSIRKTVDQLRKKGYTNREAKVLSWRKRRFLIRQFIKTKMQHGGDGEDPDSTEQDSSIDDEDTASEEEDIEKSPYGDN